MLGFRLFPAAGELLLEGWFFFLLDRLCGKLLERLCHYIDIAPLEKDDIIQEGLIGLLAATKSFSESKGTLFTTYASHCINNSIISAIKKVSRLKDIPQSNIVSIENEDMFDEKVHLSAEDEYMASESVSVLSNVLYEELSSFENEVLRLHIMGCSYAETAQKLDKTPKAVDNAMQRIRKKLSQVSFE